MAEHVAANVASPAAPSSPTPVQPVPEPTRSAKRTPRDRAWLSTAELAERWGSSVDFVEDEIHGKRIEARKLGRFWKISLVVVEAYEAALPTNMQRGRRRR